jgi:TonB family protein
MNLLFYLIFLQFLNPIPPLDPSEKITNLIIKNLRYPAQARVNKEVGIVLISLKIDEKGQLDSVSVLENPSELLTSESLRSIAILKANWESEMLGNNEFNKKYLMSFQFLSEDTDPITKE